MRECSTKHYNYIVAVGDEEVSSSMLSVRSRGSKEGKSMSVDAFKKQLDEELRSLMRD